MPLETNDSLYFGTRRVHLVHVPGRAHAFRAEAFELEERKSFTTSGSGKESKEVVVPEIPALAFVRSSSAQKTDEEDPDPASGLPVFLQQPCLKNETDTAGDSPFAVASGVRSALVRLDDSWYRLKGCGNNQDGFVVRTNPITGRKEVRGSAFLNTTYRELNVTRRLSTQDMGIPSANTPVGWFRYDADPNVPIPMAIPTTCIVQKTLGDRRLGTHGLAGLALLLPSVVDEEKLACSDLMNLFPVTRIADPSNMDTFIETSDFFTDYAMATASTGNTRPYGICWPNLDRTQTMLANGMNLEISERAPLQPPCQWTNDGLRVVPMEGPWSDLYRKIFADVSDALGQQNRSVLPYLYYQLGFESGTFLRKLHKLGYSWGTYQDKMCRKDLDEWHCNAHTNNLVLLPEGGDSFLAFLDLDMAFDDKSACNGAGDIGLSELELRTLQWREHVNFMEVLAGGDASTGLPQVAMSVISGLSRELRLLRNALTDTMMIGYLDAYFEHRSRAPLCSKTHHASHALLRLAVFVMADFVA